MKQFFLTRLCFSLIRLGTYALRSCMVCVVDVRVCLRSSVGILDEALDLTADLCTALFLHQLSPQSTEDLERQLPTFVDTELLAGTTVNFPRSLVRLAWILQHAATLLPMAGDIQAVLNSHTAGVSDIHAWGLMLPSSSRVSPVTYHSVVAVRYPDLCRLINDMWELGSFASGGLPDRPPGFQFVLWDTNARINGLVATDLETARVTSALSLPQECRVRRWALRNDHCRRPQEQPQPFSAQERICPHAPRRNNSQLSRRNSTGSNRSPAEYWFPEREVLLQTAPPLKIRKTALAESRSD